MKNKAMAGGAVGLVLLGAFFLSNLFNGFGLGPGSGLGTGGNGETDPSRVVNSTEQPETEPVSRVEPPGVDVGKILVVLIDKDQYKVLKSPDADPYDAANYRPVSLERIVEMAKTVEGSEGLKVRFGMRNNATADAEANLRNALLDAGLSRAAFRELEDPIP
jgi:hypothetical protein